MQESAATTAESSRTLRRILPVVAAIGLAGVIAGQARFARPKVPDTALPLWIGGLVVITGACAVLRRCIGSGPAHSNPWGVDRLQPRTGWTSARTLVPLAISATACTIAWYVQQTRPEDASRWDLLVVWGLAICCAFGAVWQPQPGHPADVLGDWWFRRRTDVLVLSILATLGAVPALLGLATNPWAFNGDEGGFALLSVRMLDGVSNDPFTVGYLGHPTLYNAVQAGSMAVFGRDVFAARLVCAVLGALAVPLAFLVTTRLVGRRSAGLIAAALLATFPVHLYWSHSALPNGASTFFVLLVLYLVDRAACAGGPATLVALGIATGLAQYFYFSNRLLVIVVASAIVISAIRQGRTGSITGTIRSAVVRSCLIAAGFLTATAPLLASFVRHPGQFNSRVNQVSIFFGQSLDKESARRGLSASGVIRDHVVQTAMLPFRTPPQGFLRGAVPFVGWPIAVASAVGLALVTVRAASTRWTALAVTWWASTVGMALTTGPADTNRWVLCIAPVCILAAIGLDAVGRVAAFHGRAAARVVRPLLAVLVCVTAVVNLHRFFGDANQVSAYSDLNTQVAEHVARAIIDIDPHATVYFAGAPRMEYRGFGDLVFRTPHVRSIDVEQPWLASSTPPVLHGLTIFVVLPERAAELQVLGRWFPDGVRRDVVDRRGAVLASMLVVPGT